MKKLLLLLLALPVLLVAQPKAGYYDAAVGKTDAALRTALNSIIKDPNVTSYKGLWTAYGTTDINPATGKIWDMYSNCLFTWQTDQNTGYTGPECTNYNREHSIPQSWFNQASPMVSDAFHVYPTDSKVNGIRSSFPFGEVGSATTNTTTGNGSKLGTSDFPGYTSTVFEPIDEYKGDFARTYFYMATCYAGKCESWSGGVFGNQNLGLTDYGKEIFLKWHRQDPVSTKETNRNNAVEKIQDNRNPFIDYPMLAEHIWGTKKGIPWSITSGVDALKIEFSIGPNPVQNTLNIRTDEHDMTCSIFDLNGRLLMEKTLSGTAELAVDMLENGMYLIKLTKGERNSIQKFVISR
ncbi:MAG: endonuclease [Paludibacteraceae bacterium]|nr:endonuclease [Paludibacteraceae bacterium]